MLAAVQPHMAASLTDLWAALHKAVTVTVFECEVHYLTAMALASDDDLAANLLLKKLRIATRASTDAPDRGIVRMNSYVEFNHGDSHNRFCQLVHPSAPDMPSYGLGVTSLAGSGLVGLRSGQSILWPNISGALGELTILHVENRPGPSRRIEAAP